MRFLVRFLERFIEGILEELHVRFDGLPLERARAEARELLQEYHLDRKDVLQTFLSELRVCRRCGHAWRERDMEEAEDESGPYYLCEHCS